MNIHKDAHKYVHKSEAGATTVEFALGLLILLTFLLGITDFSRMLFTWNAANEATRAGARFAVVCDNGTNQDQVLAKMQAMLPQIQSIDVVWEPPVCPPATCTGVTVSIGVLDYQWISPIAGLAAMNLIEMPAFSTYLPREIMRGDPNSEAICL